METLGSKIVDWVQTPRGRKWLIYFQVSSILFALLIENPPVVRAEPFSFTAFFISLAVSAASTAAQLGLQYLMRPKQKPVDKNKVQGDIKLSGIGEDIFITEVYGKRPADGLGGITVGGVCFYASPIRHVVSEAIGAGGGEFAKGKPSAPPERRHQYFQDFAFIVCRGPARVLSIEMAGKTAWQDPTIITPTGTTYEAESTAGWTTLGGGATNTADAFCSNGYKVTGVGNGGTITWNNIYGSINHSTFLQIMYKSNTDTVAVLSINGSEENVPLPSTNNEVRGVGVPIYLDDSDTNTIAISNPSAAVADIDRIVIDITLIENPPEPEPSALPLAEPIPNSSFAGNLISGIKYPGYSNPWPTYDNITLVDPMRLDLRSYNQYNYQPHPDADGILEMEAVSGMQIRTYPGTMTQPVDPLLQTYFEGRYGPGSTPAFRGRCIVVFENVETTDYGANMPQISFKVEHLNIDSLGEMYADRAARVGIGPTEMDFSDLDVVPIRGYGITQKQSPSTEMRILNRIFDADVYEGIEGTIKGTLPTETVVATIPADELGVKENFSLSSSGVEDFVPVNVTYTKDDEIPYYLDVGFFNAENNNDIGNVHALREVTSSDKKDNIETGLVMTVDEAQKFAVRDLQRQWAEKDSISVDTFWKYATLEPTQLIQVTDEDGDVMAMRLKGVEGWIPGSFSLKGVSRYLKSAAPRPYESAPTYIAAWLRKKFRLRYPPGQAIGTIMDMVIIRSPEGTPGWYAATCLTNQHYLWDGALLMWERETGWEALEQFPTQATMGRAIDTEILGDPPGGWDPGEWDDTNTLTIDLFYGELVSLTNAEVLDGANTMVVGEEIIAFGTATRDNDYQNRWVLSHLQRGLRGTVTTGHVADERAVLLNNAVRFIGMDEKEVGIARNFKFVTKGQDADTASTFAFTWNGKTQYRKPIYDTVDAENPVIGAAPTIYSQEDPYNQWIIFWEKPSDFGFSADNAELRIAADLSVTASEALDATETDVDVSDAAKFPTSGTIVIDSEAISYTGITGNTLTGCTRGVGGTTAATHTTSTPVYLVMRQIRLGNITKSIEPKTSFNCRIWYRWRNKNRITGDGWSAWSASAIAYGLGDIVNQNTPYSEMVSFDNDPSDMSKPETASTLWG